MSALAATTLLLLAGLHFSFRLEENPPTSVPDQPRVLDNRLELTLFAENPDIVTPIGIAVDSLNRLFVLESHTHQPPSGYTGPKGDQIKIFMDENGDGKPDKTSVYAEGLKEGVNLAFSPEGYLYVVTSKAVWVLYDRDGDGVSEERNKVLELVEPASVYAHAALLGITFSSDGWLYLSRGNTSGASWKMAGTDGATLSGYGDGGNIVRSRPDGSQLEEVATGFWNPMDLKFSDKGHLLAVDNDPDSRGPNRLVHVVPGGDYGYKSLYGGSGIHPYLAWNGELPGTLPYAVGLGEAPSGLLNASLSSLPPDYQGQLLSSIWEESRIVRINLQARGVSLTGNTEVLIEGGPEFRPVAFATDSQGAIYFTDWVLRDYPNHGRGRIWKLATRKNEPQQVPRRLYAPFLPNPEGDPLKEMYALQSPKQFEKLKKALQSADPFLRQAATRVLSGPEYHEVALGAVRDADAEVRLGALLALQQSGYQPAQEVMLQLLTDKDERIRQRTLVWVGQAGMAPLLTQLDRALSIGIPSPALFETYLETISHLDPVFIRELKNRSQPYAKSIKRSLLPQFMEQFVRDGSRPPALRALAVKMLPHPEQQLDLLTSLLSQEKAPELLLEVVRSLATIAAPAAAERLLQVVWQPAMPVQVRSEALLALTRQPTDHSAQVVPLLNSPSPDLQLEAVRYLRAYSTTPAVQEALRAKLTATTSKTPEPLRQQLTLVLSAPAAGRPASYEDWEKKLQTAGDVQRGQQVFYSLQGMCSSCHAVQGRGGDLGPDLTHVGKSKSRAQLIRSILRPSAEITPEWQGWYISLHTGEYYQGRQIDVGEKNIELYTQGTGFTDFAKKNIKEYGMIKNSLMPDGLESQLSVSDLRDLLTFLEADKK